MRDADVEDVAQHVGHQLAAALKRSGPRMDRPEALIWRIAENKARDIHRKRARHGQGQERLKHDPTAIDEHVASPEELYLDRESASRLQGIVRDALSAAPETYKRVIELHFIEGLTIEEIAARYYEESREEVDTEDPVALQAAHKRARNRVDQHLTRGKRWLAQRLADALAKEGG
jgi:RNA polymerase sigma factor (sigma-70 family)